jgi:hypothetical protein
VLKRLSTAGTIRLDSVTYPVCGRYGLHHVLAVIEEDHLPITDNDGEILIQHTRPAPGVTYVGNGRPPGMPPEPPHVSPMP